MRKLDVFCHNFEVFCWEKMIVIRNIRSGCDYRPWIYITV
jgi:hypothetical protein